MPYSVVIADDHKIVRDALRATLARSKQDDSLDFTIVAEASNGLETLTSVKSLKPDLLFLDIAMPLASGAEILSDLIQWSPDTKILVFTGVVAPGLLAGVLQTGAHGIFAKTADPSIILQQIPLILNGGHYVAPELVESIEQANTTPDMTNRERQTLSMVVSGKTNKEIARVLNISPKTVDKHRTSLMRKLDVHSTAELLARAVQDGLFDAS